LTISMATEQYAGVCRLWCHAGMYGLAYEVKP